MKKPLTIVLLGRSGSGKGEQARLLIKKLNPVLRIYTGDRLRAIIKTKTDAGRRIQRTLDGGNLVPGWLASYTWIDTFVRKLNPKMNIVIDGTPRQKIEAEHLDDVLGWFGRKDLKVLYVDVGEKEVTRRLLLRKRFDDNPRAIAHRLAYFKKSVLPAVLYYKKTKRLIRINGEQSIKKVFADICTVLHI